MKTLILVGALAALSGCTTAPTAGGPQSVAAAPPAIGEQEVEAFRTKVTSNYNPPALPNLPAGANPSIVLQVNLTPQGKLAGKPTLIQGPPIPEGPALADSAIRAIVRSEPFDMLLPEHYASWKTLQLKFDARPASKR